MPDSTTESSAVKVDPVENSEQVAGSPAVESLIEEQVSGKGSTIEIIDPIGQDLHAFPYDHEDIMGLKIKKGGIKEVLLANNVADRQTIKWYTKFNRFGALDPYNNMTMTREYLFFVKPDLHICKPKCGMRNVANNLNSQLANMPFFKELAQRYPGVINQLQFNIASGHSRYPFMNILSNSVKNTLDLPGITANEMDTSANMYGTTLTYRKTGLNSDEQIDFSLEFEDTKYLEVYMLLKTYEEYERLKSIGLVSPPNNGSPSKVNGFTGYHKNKALHDQFGVYKFIVDEDMETILYYAYLSGVYFKSVPRDAFSDLKEGGGLKYTVDFRAQFVDDMNPEILVNFNRLIDASRNGSSRLPVYNTSLHMIDGRWATNPYVYRYTKSESIQNNNILQWKNPDGMSHVYKLKWRI